MKLILIIIVCLIVFAVVCSAIDNKRLVIRRYQLNSDKVNGHVRIAFLSDMHNNQLGKGNARLITAVRDVKPDMILVGGDMITANPGKSFERVVSLMKALDDNKVPMYYGIGNHEYRMDKYREDYGDEFDIMAKRLTDAGCIILKNDSVMLDEYNIQIQGLMLDRKYYKRFKGRCIPTVKDITDYVGERNSELYRIMLAHNPEYFDVYSSCSDLVLSGHVHGGIMRLPLVGGVISTRFSLFPKYDGGIFEDKDNASTMIVSRGLGSHTIPVRIFNPVELLVIDINK